MKIYDGHWATTELLKVYLQNIRGNGYRTNTLKKRRGAQQGASDESSDQEMREGEDSDTD